MNRDKAIAAAIEDSLVMLLEGAPIKETATRLAWALGIDPDKPSTLVYRMTDGWGLGVVGYFDDDWLDQFNDEQPFIVFPAVGKGDTE